MSTSTTHYSLIKPGVNDPTDEDLWGGYLNDDLDSLDSLIWTATNWVKRDVTVTGGSTTADRNKLLLCDATGAAIVLTLPAVATAADGFCIAIKRTNSGANTVTIDGNASETIDGATTYVLNSQYESVILQCTGAAWNIVAIGGASVVTSSGTQTLSNKTLASPVVSGSVTGTIAATDYTPTLTSVTNIASSTAYDAGYLRVNSQVYVWGKVDITPTTSSAGGVATRLDISLPIASNIGDQDDLAGTAFVNSATVSMGGGVTGIVADDRAALQFMATNSSSRSWSYQFGYRII